MASKLNWKWIVAGVAGAVVIAMATALRTAQAWVGGKVVGTITLERVDGVWLEVGQAASWRRMKAAALRDGVALVANSGFRWMEEQIELYQAWIAGKRDAPAAAPGHSNHQNGRALDIAVHNSTDSVEYRWLARNAGKHGWKNAGAAFGEPWHWEYSKDDDAMAAPPRVA